MSEINIEDNNLPSSNSIDVTQTSFHQCKICEAPSALHSNFGALTCSPCKMFFKRNAEKGLKNFKCHFTGNCEINQNTRHVCSGCRLAKCLAKGMQVELIRCATSKKNVTKGRKKLITKPTTTISNIVYPTLNFIQSNQSILTSDQWNHISNLVHYYDEYGGLLMVYRFISEQNTLPLKLRYKVGPVGELMTSNMNRIQQIFEKNGDYLCLCIQDRLILLRHNVEHTSCFGGTFLLHQAHLFDDPLFYRTTEILFGPYTMATTKHIIYYFDSDTTFVKLILAILVFSTTNYTVYANTSAVNLINIKTVLSIQDAYIELAWRYMVYKYSYEQTVRRFSHLIRCLFNTNCAIVEANMVEKYRTTIDYVVEQTKQLLTIPSH